MYKALKYFEDLQDNRHPYNEGDIFPREGLTVTEERLAELSSEKNKRKEALIAFVEDAPKPLTKTDINKMKVEDLKELAKANEIEGAEEMTGDKLKEALIAKFEL